MYIRLVPFSLLLVFVGGFFVSWAYGFMSGWACVSSLTATIVVYAIINKPKRPKRW